MYDILFFVILLIVGLIAGSVIEKKHYKSLDEREENIKNLPVISLKKPLFDKEIKDIKLVSGSVVISVDFFKRFLAGLINFFGGNIASYETLIDRARREAILRMKESASGASEIINVKIETSSINKSSQNIGSVEVLVYGSAVYR